MKRKVSRKMKCALPLPCLFSCVQMCRLIPCFTCLRPYPTKNPASDFSDLVEVMKSEMCSVYTTKPNNEISDPNLEHIVPKSVLRQLGAQYSEAAEDLHNIFLTSKRINQIRSNYRFSDLPDMFLRRTKIKKVDKECWLEIGCGMLINHRQKIFVPNQGPDKGIIARAILYMLSRFPQLHADDIIKGGMSTLLLWNKMHPPSIAEILHSKRAAQLTNRSNIFLERYNFQELKTDGVFSADPIQSNWGKSHIYPLRFNSFQERACQTDPEMTSSKVADLSLKDPSSLLPNPNKKHRKKKKAL